MSFDDFMQANFGKIIFGSLAVSCGIVYGAHHFLGFLNDGDSVDGLLLVIMAIVGAAGILKVLFSYK
jgi:hypothetical protein